MASEKPIAAATRMRYRVRAETLIERFELEAGMLWQESLAEFTDWMNTVIAPSVGASTRRQYRAALAFYYRATAGVSESQAPAVRPPGADNAATGRAPHSPRRKPRTSAMRYKGIRPEDYRSLVTDLAQRGSLLGQLAGAMIVASRSFGLRPSEWIDASVASQPTDTGGYRYTLVVRNAKHDNVRTFGATRTLHTDDERLDGHEVQAALFVVDTVRVYLREREAARREEGREGEEGAHEKDVAHLVTTLNRHVRRACERHGICRHYTLYSARHQFSADAKAAGLDRFTVAALLGHASVETAGEHYGKRRAGWSGRGSRAPVTGEPNETMFRVTPDAADVAAVKARNTDAAKLIEQESNVLPKWTPIF